MYAYNKAYLAAVRRKLGVVFDYAINVHGLNTDEFWELFAQSKVARAISVGDPKYVAGMSGRELFAQFMYDTYLKPVQIRDVILSGRTREYWAGYELAFYQWYSGNSFALIHNKGMMLSDIIDMYILHEAPEQKFLEIVSERMNEDHKTGMLKRLRAYTGLTQKRLSEESGVSLRMIQLYEQGQNDLSKAQANVVVSLAEVLGCTAADLIR